MTHLSMNESVSVAATTALLLLLLLLLLPLLLLPLLLKQRLVLTAPISSGRRRTFWLRSFPWTSLPLDCTFGAQWITERARCLSRCWLSETGRSGQLFHHHLVGHLGGDDSLSPQSPRVSDRQFIRSFDRG